MNGYRRIEPAFCRGCGTPWVPGADACPSCGEAILREPPATGDPRALPKLRAVIIATTVLVAAHWSGMIGVDSALHPNRWLAITAAALGMVVVTARWWLPGGTSSFGMPRGPMPWLVAVAAGIGLPIAYGLLVGLPDDGLPLLTTEVALWYADFGPWWVALAFVGIVLEEAFFRGLLFDGVAAIGGPRNAAIASTLLFALMFIDPVLTLLGALAAILRAWSGSVGPPLLLRLAAAGTWLLWCWQTLES